MEKEKRSDVTFCLILKFCGSLSLSLSFRCSIISSVDLIWSSFEFETILKTSKRLSFFSWFLSFETRGEERTTLQILKWSRQNTQVPLSPCFLFRNLRVPLALPLFLCHMQHTKRRIKDHLWFTQWAPERERENSKVIWFYGLPNFGRATLLSLILNDPIIFW